MTRFTVGADRDQQYLVLDRAGQVTEHRHRAPVLERNDHQVAADFLTQNKCDWTAIDQFVLLAVPHSKTTVRVNATLLATSAWYFNRMLTIVMVDSLEDAVVTGETVDEQTEFDASVLGQLA